MHLHRNRRPRRRMSQGNHSHRCRSPSRRPPPVLAGSFRFISAIAWIWMLSLAGRVHCNLEVASSIKDGDSNVAGVDLLHTWASWSPWGACSRSCGGHMQRSRACESVWTRLRTKEQLCPGRRFEYSPCLPCTTDWTECSATCGGGEQHRLVQGHNMTEPCNQHACPYWLLWASWSRCTATCGTSVRHRSRDCSQRGACPGEAFHVERCPRPDCVAPSADQFSPWSSWSPCTANESLQAGFTFRSRQCREKRSCIGGRVDYARCYWPHRWTSWSACGASCGGGRRSRGQLCFAVLATTSTCPRRAAVQTEACNAHACPVHGGWTPWQDWTGCTVSCGAVGLQERRRSCTDPPPDALGNACAGRGNEIRTCHPPECPVAGGFGNWSSPTPCTRSCGTGLQVRLRTCTEPLPQHGGADCVGARARILTCNTHRCPVDGGFSSWTNWTRCSALCGGGRQNRTRACNRPAPQYGGANCSGAHASVQPCGQQPCPVDGRFGNWSDWSACSEECGPGIENRTRKCDSPLPQYGGTPCLGPAAESQGCMIRPCPVDGRWGEWSNWTDCSKWCGTGFQERFRDCDSPTPQYGGKQCPGSNVGNQTCFLRHCPINGGFGNWSVWSVCSEECGPGIKNRARKCDNPPPKYDGDACSGTNMESQGCEVVPCPIDGEWSVWTDWTNCSRWCGTGYQERFRDCNSPAPQYGGMNCPDSNVDNRTCFLRHCPIDGGFGNWSSWGVCSEACGPGIQNRTRVCDNPPPQYDGDGCSGTSMESQGCKIVPCPVDGQWGNWSRWTNCSQWCGIGFQERFRGCDSPVPRYGGEYCLGSNSGNQTCFLRHCPIDGGFGNWSSWSACSKNCGPGIENRTRQCRNPPPQYDGASCAGATMESRGCEVVPCPIDGEWSPWSDWTNCSQWCGAGFQERFRGCHSPAPLYGGKQCPGPNADNQTCFLRHCPIDGAFGDWTRWSACSKDCGPGVQNRTRDCDDPPPQYDGALCSGTNVESQECEIVPCPIDGRWSSWTDWTNCSQWCGTGFQERFRDCNSPSPQYGGQSCAGPNIGNQTCFLRHCPIDGGLGNWTSWSVCSEDCGPGIQNKTRKCDNPPPQYGGELCSGVVEEVQGCEILPCPIDGQWGNWSTWATCSQWCGIGFQERFRDCNAPVPQHGGKNCPDSNVDNRTCFLRHCPIDGGFGNWSVWSVCSEECGPGIQNRTRKCDNPPPQYDGDGCSGTNVESQGCEVVPCPIDGEWSVWTDWTNCSRWCGTGFQERFRDCNSPAPQYGGMYCPDSNVDNRTCFLRHCPIDGGFGNWSVWSVCSEDCGPGIQNRTRKCDNPPPQYDGDGCSGTNMESQGCEVVPCPIDGEWSVWTDWTNCSRWCGTGYQERFRDCSSPAPQYGGMYCPDSNVDNRTCFLRHCPIDGGFGNWSSWGVCSEACGPGIQNRTRVCDNPLPQYDGVPCLGVNAESQACEIVPCPIDGRWSGWSNWTACSEWCGAGFQERFRDCNSPSPQHGGHPCPGPAAGNQTCFLRHCPVNGSYGPWGGWAPCSTSCGPGLQQRSRPCDSPRPQHGGRACDGSSTDERGCNERPCQINGRFGQWLEWSACSVSCAEGTRARGRLCDSPAPQFGGWDCSGRRREREACALPPCPVDGGLGQWSAWEACSVTCDSGITRRQRDCSAPRPRHGGADCGGERAETRLCYLGVCPVDGMLSKWSAWSACSRSCDGGRQSRARHCDSPPPLFGGRDCEGGTADSRECNEGRCPIDGVFSSWSSWSSCSATCDAGTRARRRTCTDPAPRYDGRDCRGQATQAEECFLSPCPIAGKFGEWTAWSGCEGECERGTRARRRRCDSPAAMFGGAECPGRRSQVEGCDLPDSCAVDGEWGVWTAWSACSATCQAGEQRRERQCDSPQPQHGGQFCPGRPTLVRVCFLRSCPVDGEWSLWSPWTPCSETCGNGSHTRARSCSSPPPLYGGRDCGGPRVDVASCRDRHCPVDGGYGDWAPWSDCTASCGGGRGRRQRTCSRPEPRHGGLDCQSLGDAAEHRHCNEDICPVDGVWQAWGSWSDCSVTCGGGMRGRQRACEGPFLGGKPCAGAMDDLQRCANEDCIDGCDLINCFPGVSCTSLPGALHIGICGACPTGFTGNGLTCTNINECYNRPCFSSPLCQDTVGGFTCLPCDRIRWGRYTGPGRNGSGVADARDRSRRQTCQDVDECEDGAHECYGTCSNTQGSYSCSPCPPGYEGHRGRNCQLEDACEANLHNCDIESNYCVPGGGSAFECECVRIGYLSFGDFCYRDEDLDGFPNHANSSCRNVREWRCRTDNCPQVPNPGQEDTDRDGLGDACDEDSDNDGAPDRTDNCRQESNPSQADRDDDGVGDLCDNCPYTYNPDQADLRGRGVGNVCERDPDQDGIPTNRDNCWLVVNSRQEDQDRDGYGDHCDNCPRVPNADQADRDQDGIGDVCDTGSDRDRDGIQDDKDYCPCVANAGKRTHDERAAYRDRVYDACDEDDDNDGVVDAEDNCILVYNPSQTPSRRVGGGVGEACERDYDGDGTADPEDICPYNHRMHRSKFRIHHSITLEANAGATANQSNWEQLEQDEWETAHRGDPSVITSQFPFNNVTFSFDVFVNTVEGNGFIGIVFSYQSTQQFYVALWKKSSGRRSFGGRYARSSTAIMIKRISSASYGHIREALWSDQSVIVGNKFVSEILWVDNSLGRGWRDKQTYRWQVVHHAVQGVIRLTIFEGPRLLVDSGMRVLDSSPGRRLHGGHIGLFAFDQEQARFSQLSYGCEDVHPRDESHVIPACDVRT